MAVLLHDRSETAGQKQREALRLPRTSAVVALFAFSSRLLHKEKIQVQQPLYG